MAAETVAMRHPNGTLVRVAKERVARLEGLRFKVVTEPKPAPKTAPKAAAKSK